MCACKPVNHTSWVTVVTPTDRPKSVRNRCLIELFCGVVCVVALPFCVSVGVGAFVIGLGQISSFLSLHRQSRVFYFSGGNTNTCDFIRCQNGGTCRNNACVCLNGYTGVFCETSKSGLPYICKKDMNNKNRNILQIP